MRGGQDHNGGEGAGQRKVCGRLEGADWCHVCSRCEVFSMTKGVLARRPLFCRATREIIVLCIVAVTMALGPGSCVKDAKGSAMNTRDGARLGFVDRQSFDRDLILFRHGLVIMSFPRNYLTSVYTPQEAGSRPSIVGMATFPAMQGNSTETNDCFHLAMLRRCDVIAFQYSGIPDQGSAAFRSRRDFLLGDNTGRQEFAFGLLRTPIRNSYVYVDDAKEEIIAVSCSEFDSICSMHVDTYGTRWRVLFRVDLLDRWNEISGKFKEFLHLRIQTAGAKEGQR